MKASVLYDSKTGNTKAMAEKIAEGMRLVEGMEAQTFPIDAVDREYVKESCCVVLGTPTYMADVSARTKAFMEQMGALGLAGKLGGGFATANYVHGGGELAIQSILTHMLVCGMIVYSGGGASGLPVIHLGPVGVRDGYDALEKNFIIYGQRMAQKARELF